MSDADKQPNRESLEKADTAEAKKSPKDKPQKEFGGRDGPEPTRYGDWEKNGIISDF